MTFLVEAKYSTTKTETTELVIGTQKGVLSVKIVETANGRKRDVYAGFMEHPADTLGLLIESLVKDHKYYKAAAKAAEKWGGKIQGQTLALSSVEAQNRVIRDYDLDHFILEDGDLRDKFVRAFDGKEISPKSFTSPVDDVLDPDYEAARQRERMQDPTWGMF